MRRTTDCSVHRRNLPYVLLHSGYLRSTTIVLLVLGMLAVCAVLPGCEGGSKSKAHNGEAVAVQREFRGQQGPFPDYGVFVVQRPEAWQALWCNAQVPDVDFSRQTVIVALMGRQPTSGYDIRITEVCKKDNHIVVYISQTRPSARDNVNQAPTYPYDMVVVPRISQPVDFVVAGNSSGTLAIVDSLHGQQSLVRSPQTVVIRDQAAWLKFWSDSFGPNVAIPTVDFTRNIVAAVMLGQKPTGGYNVAITSVTQGNDRITVNFRTSAPEPGAVVTQAITAPYAIAIIPASSLPVAFHDVTP